MGESLQPLGSADELIKFSPNAVGEFACEAIKFVRANCQFSRARKWNSASTQGRESAWSHRSQYTYRAICANPLLINACDFFRDLTATATCHRPNRRNRSRFAAMILSGPPLAPSEPGLNTTVYIVGHLGRAYSETDEHEADEVTVVTGILDSQYSRPVRVIAFNVAQGWVRDVTKDIANAVLERARFEHRLLGYVARRFLEDVLGRNSVV
jgi:hypothetical protein